MEPIVADYRGTTIGIHSPISLLSTRELFSNLAVGRAFGFSGPLEGRL